MPRPGPRPYECVRRAWHSDRHQPMRGSIIQQVFRLVNEAHGARTKKNREWQEKLPIVVLKAEEIMYSKANSEAEYMDLETLWDRVNDAVNTIIRKDESNETGEFLQPCIEAALNLGCTAVRASRSQRHSNPMTYLPPTTQEPTSPPPRVFDNTVNERYSQLPLCQSGNQLSFARPTTGNPYRVVPVADRHVTQNQNPNAPRSFPFLYENLPPRINQPVAMESNTTSKLGSVYPLYYGTQYQSEESLSSFGTSQHEITNTIFVGTPIGTSISEPVRKGVLQNLFTSDSAQCTLNRLTQEDIRNTWEKAPETECDLSLQLGLSANLFRSKEKKSPQETTDVASCSSDEGGKSSDPSPQKSKEICFFPRKTGFDTFGSSSNKWNSKGGGGPNMETTLRKRKSPLTDNVEDEQFCWQPELQSNQFIGRTKWPGL